MNMNNEAKAKQLRKSFFQHDLNKYKYLIKFVIISINFCTFNRLMLDYANIVDDMVNGKIKLYLTILGLNNYADGALYLADGCKNG